jgi:hypothetical protein
LQARAEGLGPATTAARAIRLHVWTFVAGFGILTGSNWATGGGWWSFWPLAVWSVALGVHYLVYKSRTVDEKWADERTADLRSKSYDAGHIDTIVRDRAPEDPAGKRK